MAKVTGRLVEVFPSIQGEGLQVGVMQLFIRFAGCNLACRHCDTVHLREAGATFPLQPWPGHRPRPLPNPVGVDELVAALEEAYPLDDFHSISMTGGEPLGQPAFLLRLVRRLQEKRRAVFIETNGTLPDPVPELVPYVSYWSVDLKLSKGWGLPGTILGKHRRFLAALPPEKTYLKLVIDANDDPEDVCRHLGDGRFRAFPLVIQPLATAQSTLMDWDSFSILEWMRLLRPFFREVRWIPQVHKLLRIP